MKKGDNIWYGIGVMSGTSLDGLDLAFCKFVNDDKFELLAFETREYPEEIVLLLKSAYNSNGEDLKNAETYYSDYVASELGSFMATLERPPQFIACHGHTIFHQPERNMTFQMLNGHIILNETGITTILDFRSLDLALGGNGAPLVPIGDKELFSNYDACLNIGGIANISATINYERRAFDVCPANIVLNQLASEIGKDFDEDGKMAKDGSFNAELFQALNGFEYYTNTSPKSLGREWIEEQFIPRLHGFSFDERIRTCTEHIAYQIAKAINDMDCKKVLCTGGGAYNKFLISRINDYADIEVEVPSQDLVEGKEALIFAYLGKLRLENKINVLSSVTGASRDSSSGIVLSSSQLC